MVVAAMSARPVSRCRLLRSCSDPCRGGGFELGDQPSESSVNLLAAKGAARSRSTTSVVEGMRLPAPPPLRRDAVPCPWRGA